MVGSIERGLEWATMFWALRGRRLKFLEDSETQDKPHGVVVRL